MNYDKKLFSSSFLESLPQLKFLWKKSKATRQEGSINHSSTGSSLEFQDFQPYMPGDDLRYLDWNVYARTEQLHIKRFSQEKNLHLLLLVDCSASMTIGAPPKLVLALRLAVALSYLFLHNGHSVRIVLAQSTELKYSESFCQPSSINNILHFLSWIKGQGKVKLIRSLISLQKRIPSGHLFIHSDLLDQHECKSVLPLLYRKNYDISICHIMAQCETEPKHMGKIHLRDIESHAQRQFYLTKQDMIHYRKNTKDFIHSWRSYSNSQGFFYSYHNSRSSIQSSILKII